MAFSTKMPARNNKTKWLLRMAVVLGVIYIALRWFEHSQVYSPSQTIHSWSSDFASTKQDINFDSSDGFKLNGWFFPTATNSPRRQFAILVCHGNGGNISYLEKLSGRLLATGANLLLFDYRGYGNSEGLPSEAGTYRDSEAAYDWLIKSGFAPTNIIIYGESLGGGIASELTLQRNSAGLVLESTATSIPAMGHVLFPYLPIELVGVIKYDTHKKLPKITVPVMIMHSHADGLVPFRMAEENLAAANEPKTLWEIFGGHVAAGEEYHVGMEKFFTALETARSHGSAVKF